MDTLSYDNYIQSVNSVKSFRASMSQLYWEQTDGQSNVTDFSNWSGFDATAAEKLWNNNDKTFLTNKYNEAINSRADGVVTAPLPFGNTQNINITSSQPSSPASQEPDPLREPSSPFDIRLSRLMIDIPDGGALINANVSVQMPYYGTTTATSGYLISDEALQQLNTNEQAKSTLNKEGKTVQNARDEVRAERNNLINDPADIYKGTPALMNTYALTKLYGSNGGQYLINQKGKRKWYEIGDADKLSYAMNPTTSSIILWGNEDPYGRLPFHFSDFAFCKHWTKIANNRLLVLRRYPAPILDNLNFIGMDGDDPNSTTATLSLPPMATAIGYFGDGTDNDFTKILKFTTGMNWDEAKADIWKVTSTATPDNEAGPAGLPMLKMFGGIGGIAKTLSVGAGTNNNNAVLNKGNIPPDPYTDGPYENRILGPVNRINTVKKRAPGLKFEMGGLDIKFTYEARPMGGINTKAVILDILSNFLVMGSARATFFGGQHRFMSKPIKYPFAGGAEGMKAWYSGNPLKWGQSAVSQFSNQGSTVLSGIMDMFKNILGQITGGGGFEGIMKTVFDKNSVSGRMIQNYAAEKSSGEIPYLQGFKALLTGEPVGEWHLTVGNPFNPMAMIGNLICTGVEVEWGNELGPDDFPLEITFTVKLEHGMPRDADAISSMFNRGMGRIYDLPDDFKGSADYQTTVDKYTQQKNVTGNNPTPYAVMGYAEYGGFGKQQLSSVVNSAVGPSVWSPVKVYSISPTVGLEISKDNNAYRSSFRKLDWIKKRALS
jgi:hypothetical protein